jgi:twitching motility protein PilT
MIREGKTYQIESALQTGSKYGMKTMDMSLVELYKKKIINYEDALAYAADRDMLIRLLSL